MNGSWLARPSSEPEGKGKGPATSLAKPGADATWNVLPPPACPAKMDAMLRIPIIAVSFAITACGGEQPVHSPSSAAPLFRGGQGEVRLRCGSESLRARLRQGQIAVQVGAGERTVLVPVADPRAESGQAYGDGRLTLYKIRDTESWRLARSAAPAPGAECKREPRVH
jgi:hypothetical protein